MKIRIRFGKYGHLRFVGHLDVMRFFQKAMKRGGVDIAYSQGFSPHQIMSFAQPLGLGMSSDAEYMDVELNSAASGKEVMDKLNAVSVPELPVLSCRKLPDNAKAGMAIIEAASPSITHSTSISVRSR